MGGPAEPPTAADYAWAAACDADKRIDALLTVLTPEQRDAYERHMRGPVGPYMSPAEAFCARYRDKIAPVSDEPLAEFAKFCEPDGDEP